MSISTHPDRVAALSFVVLLFLSNPLLEHTSAAQTAGALGNGTSAATVARGGTMAAERGDPLEAVEGNPAGLAGLATRTVDVSGLALFARGSFVNSVDAHGSLRPFSGTMPYGAYGTPVGHTRLKAAVGITPEFLMRAAWQYIDPPGTAAVSYGSQKNESQLIALRGSVTAAYPITSKLSAGGSVGLIYNDNLLHAPYIFQQQPQLAGLKVLLDLHTQGFGWNGSGGLQWQPITRLRLGAAWKSATYVPSHGSANGSASVLFTTLGIAADPSFHYRAEVDNHLPQTIAAGLHWQATRQVGLGFEGDWTNWTNAFNRLPVKLNGGTNAVINTVAGSANIQDQVPLHWRNQGSFRSSIELPMRRQWTVRGGFSHSSNPVPSSTITPLTAAILSNSIATGLGWRPESSGPHPPIALSSWQWDVAYQVQLPASQSVGQSSLLAGEYNDTRIHVMTQAVTLSARLNF